LGRQRGVQILIHKLVDAHGFCEEPGGGCAGVDRQELF